MKQLWQSIQRPEESGSRTRYKWSILELIKTNEILTCGIVNIPLTYPAYLYFSVKSDKLLEVIRLFDSFKIKYSQMKSLNNKDELIFHLRSMNQVEPKTLKNIWRNFKLLRPKFDSEYRYPFWEIDTKDESIRDNIIGAYTSRDLPVFVQESQNGYHFISLKPILKCTWEIFVNELRFTNPNWPPVTIRIKPNKYVGEINIYRNNWIISRVFHRDTADFKKLVDTQQLEKLQHNYIIVWYRLDGSGNQ